MTSINKAMLQARIDSLNSLTNNHLEPYTKSNTGKLQANIGSYYLDAAYGGYNLARIENKGGGISCPIGQGFYPKRELLNKINAYIAGIHAQQEKTK